LSRIYIDSGGGLCRGCCHSRDIEFASAGWEYSFRQCLRHCRSANPVQMKEEVLPPVDETIGAGAMPPPLPPPRSASIFRKRIRKFRTHKSGYYSFLILAAAYAFFFILPVLTSNKALSVHY